MSKIDKYDDRDQGTIDEQKLFDEHPGFQFFVELFMVLHIFLSSIRGILYGFSFIIFEDKFFGERFRKCIFKCCCKNADLDKFDNIEDDQSSSDQNPEGILMSESSSENLHWRKFLGLDCQIVIK